MPQKLVGPAQRTTPAELRATARRDIPADLQREASRRLGVIALLGAALWTIAPILGHLIGASSRAAGGGLHYGISDAIATASVLVSIGVFLYSRGDRDPGTVLDVGLGYMVLIAFALGQMFHSQIFVHGSPVDPMISWIGAVVLMFAAIVPSTPAKTLIAGLLAASMNPLGMLIAKWRGNWDFGPTSNVLVMHYPDYLLVGVRRRDLARRQRAGPARSPRRASWGATGSASCSAGAAWARCTRRRIGCWRGRRRSS